MHHKDHPLREDAFYTNLYRRHAPGLFAYVYRQTASREDAEDIVLEVFLMVLRQSDFATFDAQKQIAWLWTITRHKVVDRFRMSARQQHVPLDGLADTLYEDDEISPGQSPQAAREVCRPTSVHVLQSRDPSSLPAVAEKP